MLDGDITVVRADEVWRCFAVFAAVGILHFIQRKKFLLVSFDRERAYEAGLRVRWWDFLFYALFGLVVTIFVRVAGVLLVFSYLIVPAVCAIALTRRIALRLLIGWIVSLVGGIAGLYLSFYGDFPSGAAIVCTFGALLVIVSVATLFRPKPDRLV
jgi:zinc/manganese transport system permease protein